MSLRPLKLGKAILYPSTYASPIADFSNYLNIKLSDTVNSNTLIPGNLLVTREMLNNKVTELNQEMVNLSIIQNNGLYLYKNNVTVKYGFDSIKSGSDLTFLKANIRGSELGNEWFAVVD